MFKTKLEALQTYADAIKADGDPAEHQQVLDTIAQLQQRYQEVRFSPHNTRCNKYFHIKQIKNTGR